MPDTIEAFLRALPTAAGSPTALVAYLVVVGTSTFLLSRTKRNKQLLQHLKSLPSADRLKALELEMGAVRIPDGLTPEQWLRARSQTYFYSLGLVGVLGLLLVVVLAILESQDKGKVDIDVQPYVPGNEGIAPRIDGGHVRLDWPREAREPWAVPAIYRPGRVPGFMTVDWHPPDPSLYTLVYRPQRVDDSNFQLTPDLPYRTLFASGGPVPGLDVQKPPFVWDFPAIQVTFNNGKSRSTVATEAIFDVDRAEPVQDVLVVWDDMTFTNLVLHNEGWATVASPSLTIDAQPEEACSGNPSPTQFATEVRIAPFDDIVTVPILQYLPSSLRVTPIVCVFGRLAYDDPKGVRHEVKYKTRVQLQIRASAPLAVSNVYQVMLHAKGGRTQVRMPMSQQLAPGESDRIIIRIGADMSGLFHFTVSIRLIDGTVQKKATFSLETFVPRSDATHSTRAQ